MDINMVGPGIILGLACMGSAAGCGIAGMASHAIMARVEEGHTKYIGMSVIPASQSIFGFIMTILMRAKILSGVLSPVSGIFIALFIGAALMASSIFQGRCAATGMQAIAKNPALFMKTIAAIGVIESFALFAFVFSLIIMR